MLVVVGPVTDWLPIPVWVVALVALVAIAYVVVMPLWRYRGAPLGGHRHRGLHPDRAGGSRERRIAPMSRIQTVDHAEGALARLFGLATVTVTTASAAGALEIVGLDRDRALALVEELTVRGRHRARATPRDGPEPGWQRLDPRMLLVYPVRELIRFLPA